LARANEHIKNFDALMAEFVKLKPYRDFVEPDPDTGEMVCTLRRVLDVPYPLAEVTADAINNMRHALDHAVCACAQLNGHAKVDDTYFPFGNDAAHFESQLLRKTRRVPEAVKTLIRDYQPYPGGGDTLWALHKLCNADKHQTLIPVMNTFVELKIESGRMGGGLSAVLSAPIEELRAMPGVGQSVALDLKLMQEAALRMGREILARRPLISSWSALLAYVRTALAHEPREQFRVRFLDRKNQLIADEMLGRGTVDHAPVYPREVARRALELSACALILVHNHPTQGTFVPQDHGLNRMNHLNNLPL
jgi:DNA repair protein RadC